MSSLIPYQLDDLHDDKDASILLTGHQAPPDVADPECPGTPPLSPDSSIHPGSDLPGLKRLISSTLSMRERVPLITAVFSNRDEVKMIRHLCGDDAQTLIDIVYEVYISTLFRL